MNSVSWFLYLADVITNLGNVLLIVIALSPVAVLLAFFAVMVSEGEVLKCKDFWRYIRIISVTLVTATLCNIFIPSKNTMYAIASSEVGERVIKSEAVKGVANDATKALQQWIKRQIVDPTNKP